MTLTSWFVDNIISLIAIFISIISLLILIFTSYFNNRRKLEPDIWFDDEDIKKIVLCVYNPSFRSVPIINKSICINNESIVISEKMVSVTYENGQQIHFMAEYIEQMELPQILGEGQAVFYSISAEVLATLAFKNEHMGIVKVSGIFKTADKKIYKTKSIDLNIDKYKMD